MPQDFMLLDGERGAVAEVDAEIDGARVLIGAEDIARTTGWTLKPEGLCRDAMCVPVRDAQLATTGGRIDLERFATALQRPLALDVAESSAFLGASAAARGEQRRGMQAPDFTLPDLDGRMHSLSEHHGKKVLLLAYASW
jgi:AhpC/TSA family